MEESELWLDSHVFIWALEQTHKIGAGATRLIHSAETVYVSRVSLWELAIKHKAGKFPYDTKKLTEGLAASGFGLLSIEPAHLQAYPRIELAHKDPFRTLLAAQAKVEHCTLITADTLLFGSKYKTADASV